ncbi:hypothetical protein OIDMADRAFT_51651 [Oidiodendron maius Zn]|uniref:Uncharacterized protein n=1 Tax=Oidiodendron maius (strain Zn) TaxID=913774 RepID=A0A0C3CXH6_OIDMZ|nr:hypothetical protein OIDMADRAFT_51651 [Oidiodendron maius Zn]
MEGCNSAIGEAQRWDASTAQLDGPSGSPTESAQLHWIFIASPTCEASALTAALEAASAGQNLQSTRLPLTLLTHVSQRRGGNDLLAPTAYGKMGNEKVHAEADEPSHLRTQRAQEMTVFLGGVFIHFLLDLLMPDLYGDRPDPDHHRLKERAAEGRDNGKLPLCPPLQAGFPHHIP